LTEEFAKQQKQLNEAFWSPEKKFFAFAVDRDNKRVDEPTVLTTVPMWFGLTDETKSQQTIAELSKPEHQADWGMRIISNHAAKYSGGGYHYGSVWPLFTGWASVAEYRYHRPQPAYDNLRANALLALDGSPGHVTEVLSGDYYQPLSTSSPHQIWSAAMVISPMLRGLFGLEGDAIHHTLTFAPHVPANWRWFSVEQVRLGEDELLFNYEKTEEGILLEAGRTEGSGECVVEFRPAISMRAKVQKVDLNGKSIPFRVEMSKDDQHVVVRFPIKGTKNFLRIFFVNDFGFSSETALPLLGAPSQGLRILSQTWSPAKDRLELKVSGAPGHAYDLKLFNTTNLDRVEGAELNFPRNALGPFVSIQIPATDSEPFPHARVVFYFGTKSRGD
jgi:hypothetical protein